jgi:hypothetical protein
MKLLHLRNKSIYFLHPFQSTFLHLSRPLLFGIQANAWLGLPADAAYLSIYCLTVQLRA